MAGEKSRADCIEEILKKGCNNITEIIKEVKTMRPEDNEQKIKSQLSAILKCIEVKSGRWSKYTKDTKSFKIIEK